VRQSMALYDLFIFGIGLWSVVYLVTVLMMLSELQVDDCFPMSAFRSNKEESGEIARTSIRGDFKVATIPSSVPLQDRFS